MYADQIIALIYLGLIIMFCIYYMIKTKLNPIKWIKEYL